ncbi:hypothetical protein GCM10010495_62760 [Kitasatospora herbaricolor]|nr:hypothetical protein GCM10010495_62760 [Kitasatospora herbaricolor]
MWSSPSTARSERRGGGSRLFEGGVLRRPPLTANRRWPNGTGGPDRPTDERAPTSPRARAPAQRTARAEVADKRTEIQEKTRQGVRARADTVRPVRNAWPRRLSGSQSAHNAPHQAMCTP